MFIVASEAMAWFARSVHYMIVRAMANEPRGHITATVYLGNLAVWIVGLLASLILFALVVKLMIVKKDEKQVGAAQAAEKPQEETSIDL